MKKVVILLLILFMTWMVFWVYQDNREVQVIAVHHSSATVAILVNTFPLSDAKRIQWWRENQPKVYAQNHIKSQKDGGPFSITIFKFGDGYQEEGKEDRLCFEDVPAPANCIDKDILMGVFYMRDGKTDFGIENSSYILDESGNITKIR